MVEAAIVIASAGRMGGAGWATSVSRSPAGGRRWPQFVRGAGWGVIAS